jgi:hypothetical protein
LVKLIYLFVKTNFCDQFSQVAASIEPVLKVKHFEELVLASQDARNRLQDLGCFSDVEIHIDTSEDGGKSDYEVIYVMYRKMFELYRTYKQSVYDHL